jgi:hypothetical protein
VPAQAEPVPAHAVRAPCGAPTIGEHVPRLALESHASHCPVQVVLQHTPSTQYPLVHWPGALQEPPFASCAVHTPAEHHAPCTQSPSTVQLPWQVVPLQPLAPQTCVCTAGHAPAPLQPAASVATPCVQLGARHCTVESGYAQLVAEPLHVPAHIEPSDWHTGRVPWGAPVTGVHVPTLPETSHASH